jgi:DNA-binding CsgD family transcriptional regulator/CheY-like chemotaxis protein
MDDRDRLLRLVELVYAAPGSVEGWRQFLLALCGAIDGTAASFISHDLLSGSGDVAVTVGADAGALSSYTSHWIREDPWAHSPQARTLKTGAIVLGHAIMPRVALKRTAFYNDFSRRYDIAQSIVSVIESGTQRLSGFSINGSDTRAEFGAPDVALLTVLMPHMQRALELHRRLSHTESERHFMDEALNVLRHAVFLTDSSGRIRYVNRAGEVLLRSRDGLSADRGVLRATSDTDAARLRQLLGWAAETAGGTGFSAGGRLFVGRPSGRRPLRLLVAPAAGGHDTFGTKEPRALVFATDPDQRSLPSEAELRALFRLTGAEARLARALAEGLTLTQAARRFLLSPTTLRTRLKAIFEKTGTHRQSELSRLIREWPPG